MRERSVWRIESLRFRVGLLVVLVEGSADEAARSSIISIWEDVAVSVSSSSSFSFFALSLGSLICAFRVGILVSFEGKKGYVYHNPRTPRASTRKAGKKEIRITLLYRRAIMEKLTCFLTLSIIRSINGAGHGKSSDTARSATQ